MSHSQKLEEAISSLVPCPSEGFVPCPSYSNILLALFVLRFWNNRQIWANHNHRDNLVRSRFLFSIFLLFLLLGSPGLPVTHCVVQADLQFMVLLLQPQVMECSVCHLPGCWILFSVPGAAKTQEKKLIIYWPFPIYA